VKVIEIPDFHLMDLPSDGKETTVISSETGSYQLFSISTETTEATQLSTGEDRVIYAVFFPGLSASCLLSWQLDC